MSNYIRLYKLCLGESFYLGSTRCVKRGWFTAYREEKWFLICPLRRVKNRKF